MNCSNKHRENILRTIKRWEDGELEAEGGHAPKMSLFHELHRMIYRNVLFDVFPRFKMSKHCTELVTLHLNYTLTHEVCREGLYGSLSGTPLSALKFWLDAHKCADRAEIVPRPRRDRRSGAPPRSLHAAWPRKHSPRGRFESQYESLASGWPSSTSVSSAKVVFRTHEPLLRELCAPNLVSQIQRQLNEVRARRAIAQQMPVSPMRVADGAPALVGADHFVQSCEARGPQLYVRRLRPMA